MKQTTAPPSCHRQHTRLVHGEGPFLARRIRTAWLLLHEVNDPHRPYSPEVSTRQKSTAPARAIALAYRQALPTYQRACSIQSPIARSDK